MAPTFYIAGNERFQGAVFPAPAATYTGPGDLVSGWLTWWGFQGINAAYIGQKAVRLVRASDSAEQDFNIVASGAVDVAGITSFLTATTGKIVTLYDQTGHGVDLTQATDGNRPAYTAAPAIGSLPGVTFGGGDWLASAISWATAGASAAPYSVMAVAERTGNTSALNAIFGSSDANEFIGFSNAVNKTEFFEGANQIVGAGAENDNVPHVILALANGVSSKIVTDGATSTSGAGAGSVTWIGTPNMGNTQGAGGTFPFAGIFGSGGFINGDKSSSFIALNTNAHSFWGF